jgi:hypothetical protein
MLDSWKRWAKHLKLETYEPIPIVGYMDDPLGVLLVSPWHRG